MDVQERVEKRLPLLANDGENGSPSLAPMSPNAAQKSIYGILLVLGIACSWVAATQFSQIAVTWRNFHAPLFTNWFGTSFNIICYPIYILLNTLLKRKVKSQIPFAWRDLIFRSFFFYLAWIIANYCYVKALQSTPATIVTAISSITPLFVYVLSILLLHEDPRQIFKGIAVFVSIGGLLSLSLYNVEGGSHWIGYSLTVASSIAAAVYKVFFKYSFGDASAATVTAVLTCIGTYNIFLTFAVVMVLNEEGLETFQWDGIPWLFITGGAFLSLIFNFLINFGIAYTYPLFVSLGMVLGIPLNAVVDVVWHHKYFNAWQIVGCVLIAAGFFLLLLPWTLTDVIKKVKLRSLGSKPHTAEET